MIDIWAKITRKYEKEPPIAGYDIPNEPWIYNSIVRDLDGSQVDAFYLKVITAIRTIDPNHTIFLEPANLHTSTFPLKDNIVWSPHFYTVSFALRYYPQNITLLEADFMAQYKRVVLDMGGPMWIGEFGAFMRDNTSSQEWLEHAIKIFSEYHTGWAWWAYYGKGGPIPTPLYTTGI